MDGFWQTHLTEWPALHFFKVVRFFLIYFLGRNKSDLKVGLKDKNSFICLG